MQYTNVKSSRIVNEKSVFRSCIPSFDKGVAARQHVLGYLIYHNSHVASIIKDITCIAEKDEGWEKFCGGNERVYVAFPLLHFIKGRMFKLPK